MKVTSLIACALATFALCATGCSKADTTMSTSGKGFTLSDIGDQSIKQADSNAVRVSIDRIGGFDGEVTIELSGLPAGVSVDGGNKHVILAKDSAVSLKLLANDSAAPTEKSDVLVKASANVGSEKLSKQDNFNLTIKPKS